MAFDSSPSMSEFSDGHDDPEDLHKPKTGLRIVLGVVVLVLLVAVLVTLAQKNGGGISLGKKAAVSGYAVDEFGKPLQVEAFIHRTDLRTNSDKDGYFEFEKVPPGKHSIIVAFQEIGSEVVVNVQPGVPIELGKVKVLTYLLDEINQ